MRRFSPMLLVAVLFLSSACAHRTGNVAPAPAPGSKPFLELVRRAVRERQPDALAASATGQPQFLYLLGDGRGRLAEAALERRRPKEIAMPMAMSERYPALPVDEWFTHLDAAFPLMGLAMFRPGDVIADTLYVFWAEPPVPIGKVPPPLGPYRLGLATSEQITPDTVMRFVRGISPGRTVWFVRDDEQRVLGIGTWEGDNPDVLALQPQLASRFPGGDLTCSLGMSIPGAGGRLVRTVPIRYQPRRDSAGH